MNGIANKSRALGRPVIVLSSVAALTLIAAGVSALASHDSRPQNELDTVTREVTLLPGAAVTIHHASGAVRIIAWARPTAHFRFTYPAGTTSPDTALPIDFTESESGVELHSGALGAWPGLNAGIGLEVHVPIGTPVNVNVRNGAIYAAGLEAPIRAATGNGAILCEHIAGTVRLETRNGDIECRYVAGHITARTGNGAILVDDRQNARHAELDLVSENGPVRVSLPHDANFHIDAQAHQGRIRSDFFTDDLSGFGLRRMVGAVAGGGPRLLVRALNGTVRIDRG